MKSTDPETGKEIITEGENILISTNNITGYKLYMSMNPKTGTPQNSALNHTVITTASVPSIPSISTPTPLEYLPSNTWAYNVPSLPEHGTDYQPLPPVTDAPTTSGHNIASNTKPSDQDVINVRFATKVDMGQTGGTYANKVLYTAVINDAPQPTPQPTPNPPSEDSVENAVNSVYNPDNTANNNNNTKNSATDAYSDPQGVQTRSNKTFVTGQVPWFLFIFLLVLSVLILGIILFLFWRKRRKDKDEDG